MSLSSLEFNVNFKFLIHSVCGIFSLLPFLRGIIEQDYDLVRPFAPYLLRFDTSFLIKVHFDVLSVKPISVLLNPF